MQTRFTDNARVICHNFIYRIENIRRMIYDYENELIASGIEVDGLSIIKFDTEAAVRKLIEIVYDDDSDRLIAIYEQYLINMLSLLNKRSCQLQFLRADAVAAKQM